MIKACLPSFAARVLLFGPGLGLFPHCALAQSRVSAGSLSAEPGKDDASLQLGAASNEYEEATRIRRRDPARSLQLFEASAARFQAIIDGGVRNGYLEYNLGNACLQAGRLGEAILHYRRAEREIPSDEHLRDNLAAARRRCLTMIQTPRSSVIWRSVFFWHYATSLSSRYRFAAASYIATWSLIGLRVVLMRRGLVAAAGISAALALGAGGSALVQSAREWSSPPGVIISADVPAHTGPGTGYERQFAQSLQPGVEFVRMEQRGEWWRIGLSDGRGAWIPAASAELILPDGSKGGW